MTDSCLTKEKNYILQLPLLTVHLELMFSLNCSFLKRHQYSISSVFSSSGEHAIKTEVGDCFQLGVANTFYFLMMCFLIWANFWLLSSPALSFPWLLQPTLIFHPSDLEKGFSTLELLTFSDRKKKKNLFAVGNYLVHCRKFSSSAVGIYQLYATGT